jgi:Flp pilus assembly protein TadD
MTRRVTSKYVTLLVPLFLVLAPGTARSVGSGPAPAPVAPRPAETDYNAGLQAKAAKQYATAASHFRRAVDARPDFPEAWNELGYALRQIGKFEEALTAYDHALRLRPNFPEAMEYLGEAYVKLGRLDDARAVLDRLKGLDTARALELEDAIRAGR